MKAIDRFISQYVQYDRNHKFGLWGVYDYKHSEYIATGSKGDMNKLHKLLIK